MTKLIVIRVVCIVTNLAGKVIFDYRYLVIEQGNDHSKILEYYFYILLYNSLVF